MALGKQNVKAACPKDKLEFKVIFIREGKRGKLLFLITLSHCVVIYFTILLSVI